MRWRPLFYGKEQHFVRGISAEPNTLDLASSTLAYQETLSSTICSKALLSRTAMDKLFGQAETDIPATVEKRSHSFFKKTTLNGQMVIL
ncbi:hypothetical protein OH492_11090 [Vibrio chagasii]|nr:hypothetical protein [Vibrio chagasii]